MRDSKQLENISTMICRILFDAAHEYEAFHKLIIFLLATKRKT